MSLTAWVFLRPSRTILSRPSIQSEASTFANFSCTPSGNAWGVRWRACDPRYNTCPLLSKRA
eukprot:6770115-Alexandrium_andersonii.AAC.1